MITLINSIRNIVASFFYLIALGLTQIGNFFVANKKRMKL